MDSSNINIFTDLTVDKLDEMLDGVSVESKIIMDKLEGYRREKDSNYRLVDIPYTIIFKTLEVFPETLTSTDIIQSRADYVAMKYMTYFTGNYKKAKFKSYSHKVQFIEYVRSECGHVYDNLLINHPYER